VCCSWVDPHFAALYARREEERLAEQLVMRLRERDACEPPLDPVRRDENRRLVTVTAAAPGTSV
jgi:hypothetical protein